MRRLLLPVLCLAAASGSADELSRNDRGRVKQMLHTVSNDLKEHYYDAKFHGIDLDAEVAAAEVKIDAATSIGMALSHVAAVLESLHDSHTWFLPPARRVKVEYGYHAAMIGDRCFITQVKPNSDAEQKGLRPGDELFAINNYGVSREALPKIEFVYNVLRPQLGLRLDVKHPGSELIPLDVMAETREVIGGGVQGSPNLWDEVREIENRHQQMATRYRDVGNGVAAARIYGFSEVDEGVLKKVLAFAREHRALVLDLRGNPGGSVENLATLAGMLFGKQVLIADRVYRDKKEPLITEARDDAFSGKLVVLVDSESASASEIFARLVQIEKRGTVIGDLTRGHVMQSVGYPHDMRTRASSIVSYGASVTEADVVMADGMSLERRGVTPDVRMTPTAEDLVDGRDPVLARAIEIAGGKATPEEAGKMFAYSWPDL